MLGVHVEVEHPRIIGIAAGAEYVGVGTGCDRRFPTVEADDLVQLSLQLLVVE